VKPLSLTHSYVNLKLHVWCYEIKSTKCRTCSMKNDVIDANMLWYCNHLLQEIVQRLQYPWNVPLHERNTRPYGKRRLHQLLPATASSCNQTHHNCRRVDLRRTTRIDRRRLQTKVRGYAYPKIEYVKSHAYLSEERIRIWYVVSKRRTIEDVETPKLLNVANSLDTSTQPMLVCLCIQCQIIMYAVYCWLRAL